jgi:hypothetical protein
MVDEFDSTDNAEHREYRRAPSRRQKERRRKRYEAIARRAWAEGPDSAAPMSDQDLEELARAVQEDLSPRPTGFVLWLKTRKDDWAEHHNAPTERECYSRMDLDWPDSFLPIRWVVLPAGQRPGPDTKPDLTIDLNRRRP